MRGLCPARRVGRAALCIAFVAGSACFDSEGSLKELRSPALFVIAPDAAAPAPGPGLVVRLQVAGEPPCARVGSGVTALANGGRLELVSRGGSDGLLGDKGGPRCNGPLFNGPRLAPGAARIEISDATQRIEAEFAELATPRHLRPEGQLRAGRDAVVVWTPATDRFPAGHLPRVSFVYDDDAGRRRWEVAGEQIEADGRIRFRVPPDATPGRGNVWVSASGDSKEVVPALVRCSGVRLCVGSVQIGFGRSAPAEVVR